MSYCETWALRKTIGAASWESIRPKLVSKDEVALVYFFETSFATNVGDGETTRVYLKHYKEGEADPELDQSRLVFCATLWNKVTDATHNIQEFVKLQEYTQIPCVRFDFNPVIWVATSNQAGIQFVIHYRRVLSGQLAKLMRANQDFLTTF